MSKNPEAASHDKAREIARLKYHYHLATNGKVHGVETPDPAHDGESKNRKKLTQRLAPEAQGPENQIFGNRIFENQAFVERLRDRMTGLGVTQDQIKQAERSAPDRPPDASKRLTKERTAILVIHGIGEQKPYETLDQFSRNLMRYLSFEGGISDLQISADRYDHNDDVEARIRLSTQSFGPKQGGLIDIYEYYWAPQTEGKISYKQTLAWLFKTTFTPIFFLGENIQEMANTGRKRSGEKTPPDERDEPLTKGAIFRRELLRIAWIYLPLILVLCILAYLLSESLMLPATVKQIFVDWAKAKFGVKCAELATVFCFLSSLLLGLMMVQQVWKNQLRRVRRQPAIVKGSWIFQTFIVGLLFASAGVGIARLSPIGLSGYFSPFRHREVLVFAVGAVLAMLTQYFLKNFIGDVAVYTNVDARAANFLVRKAILAGSTNALVRLLREEHVLEAGDTYDQVIVAGHSLGSVIAYDTLNQLLNKRVSRADQIVGHVPAKTEVTQEQLKKILGLMTFGSPLDKVHYFFRENVSQHQAVRAQLLQFLQSFRKRPSNFDYGLYRFQRYDATALDGVLWLNAWSKQDPVSGALHFYTGLTRRHFEYPIPIYAHLSYWEDIHFYEFFAEPLLLGNHAALKEKAMTAGV